MINSQNNLTDIMILVNQNQYNEASELFLSRITEMKKENSPFLPEYYYEYGLFLFNLQEYEMALIMLQSAYNSNYKQKEIEDFIYCSFIIPNYEEFENTYNRNLLLYKDNIISNCITPINELPIDFIPYAENKYFMFDKHSKVFEGTVDVSEYIFYNFKQINLENEFSDIIYYNTWNPTANIDLFQSFRNRLIYFISSDIKKTLSFFKLPEFMDKLSYNLIFIDSLSNLQNYFHCNTSIYLPRLYYGNTGLLNYNQIQKIIKEEHEYRLTPQGRNKDNILLTFAIPSYNRGHRALRNILSLLQSQYDAEIEFVISNNGSQINTEGYDEISKLQDRRITYFEFLENQGAHVNFCQVINISNGKYTCLLSDEDSINITAITHYLNVFKTNPDISFATSSGLTYYRCESSQFFAKGKEAFLNSFLKTNYITGLIYKTDLFHSLNMYNWTLDNMFQNKAVDYYCHSCWVMFFTLYGEFYEGNVLLFKEGIAEKDQHTTIINSKKPTVKISTYTTLESRIEQHTGFIQILNQLLDSLDFNTYFSAYLLLCQKTYYLLSLVKNYYVNADVRWNSICDDLYKTCVDGILRLNITLVETEKNILIQAINDINLYFRE